MEDRAEWRERSTAVGGRKHSPKQTNLSKSQPYGPSRLTRPLSSKSGVMMHQ